MSMPVTVMLRHSFPQELSFVTLLVGRDKEATTVVDVNITTTAHVNFNSRRGRGEISC